MGGHVPPSFFGVKCNMLTWQQRQLLKQIKQGEGRIDAHSLDRHKLRTLGNLVDRRMVLIDHGPKTEDIGKFEGHYCVMSTIGEFALMDREQLHNYFTDRVEEVERLEVDGTMLRDEILDALDSRE